MKLDEIEVGKQCIYYPPKETADDNRHFPALVEWVAKRVKVRIFMEGAPDGITRSVSAARLEDGQGEIL